MTNRVHEHKIIALQAVIFLSLLLVLSFILEGCSINKENIDKLDVDAQELRLEIAKPSLFTALT